MLHPALTAAAASDAASEIQQRTLSGTTRAGRIGEHVARSSQAREIDAAFEEGEHAREHGGVVDPVLVADEDDAI